MKMIIDLMLISGALINSPSIPTPPPPPEPIVEPPPEIESKDAAGTESDIIKRLRRQRGHRSTLVTGSLGDTSPLPVKKSKLSS